MNLLLVNWRQYISDELLMESYMGDWAKHSTLNIGQVIRHLRYLFDLPDKFGAIIDFLTVVELQ